MQLEAQICIEWSLNEPLYRTPHLWAQTYRETCTVTPRSVPFAAVAMVVADPQLTQKNAAMTERHCLRQRDCACPRLQDANCGIQAPFSRLTQKHLDVGRLSLLTRPAAGP
jgi:hypothetical protein